MPSAEEIVTQSVSEGQEFMLPDENYLFDETHLFFKLLRDKLNPERRWEIYGPWMRPVKAAEILGVGTATVRRWAKEGYIRYYSEVNKFTYNADDVFKLTELISGYSRPGLWLIKLKLLDRKYGHSTSRPSGRYRPQSGESGTTEHQ